jgi:hypothetical protein
MSDIGKIKLNFQVLDSGDPEILLVADYSRWRVIKNMPAYLEIKTPNRDEPIVSVFAKEKTNGFNSLSLNLSSHIDCEENTEKLPDGIYNIQLKAGKDGERVLEKNYLKKDNFQNDLDEVWIKLDLEYSIFNTEIMNKLLVIEGLLRAASANARKGLIPQAKDAFKLATTRLKAYKECKDCI